MKEKKSIIKNMNKDTRTILDFDSTFSDQIEVPQRLLEESEKPGGLDAKTAELINVALSTKLLNRRLLVFHLKRESEEGASRQEIIDAANLAILISGKSTLIYLVALKFALDEYDQLKKATSELY